MKKMLFTGDLPVLLPTLNLLVHKGDTVDVPDDFEAEGFSEASAASKAPAPEAPAPEAPTPDSAPEAAN